MTIQSDQLKSEVSPGWKRTTLGAIGEYINGRGFKKSEWGVTGLPIVRIQDLTGTGKEKKYFDGEIDERHVINPGDLLISWAATLGAYIWSGPKAALNQHIFKVNSYINKKLHYYIIRHILDDLYRQTHGSGMVHITKDKFEATPIEVPSSGAQQEKIVAEIEKQFSRLDEAVANLKRVKANLKRYKAAVLKAAVEGKLTEDWRKQHPNVEPASKLLERILRTRRSQWKGRGNYKEPAAAQISDSSQLPTMPEGWTFVSLEQLLPPMREAMKTGPFGSLLKKHEHQAQGVAVLGIENIEAMRFVRGSKIHITQRKAEDLTDYKVMPCDVLISRSGTVGEVCVVPKDIGEARISTNLMKVSLARDGMLPEFFALLFNGSPFILNQVADLCKGSTRSFLNQEILRQLCFVLPPLAEQREIVAEVERRLSIIEEFEAAIQADLTRADRLRQSILSQAFSGKLVPNALQERSA